MLNNACLGVSWNNKAAATVLDASTKQLKFVQWVDGPFSTSKFVVRKDPTSAHGSPRYYAVSTNATREAIALGQPGARNNLVFSTSTDLLSWRVCSTLLRDDTGFTPTDSIKYTGFEYPDWVFDGDDIMVGIRTAYRGAVSAGSSNRMTSLRLTSYRRVCGI